VEQGSPEWRGDVRVAGRLDGGGVQAGDGSLVGNGGDGEVLEHRGANRGVRCSAKDKGSSGAAEITKGAVAVMAASTQASSTVNFSTSVDKRRWGAVPASCAVRSRKK
jgi:hypothetical protein